MRGSGEQVLSRETIVNVTVRDMVEELRRRLQRHYGHRLCKVILYGSQARGDAETGSDVDVLVVLEGVVDAGEEIRATSPIAADLSLSHDQVVCLVFVSRDDFEIGEWPLLYQCTHRGSGAMTPTQRDLLQMSLVALRVLRGSSCFEFRGSRIGCGLLLREEEDAR